MDVANTNALAEGDFSGVGLLFRAEDGEKSGFACAVRTNEADAVTVMDCEEMLSKRGVAPKRLEIFCAIRIGGIFPVYGEEISSRPHPRSFGRVHG